MTRPVLRFSWHCGPPYSLVGRCEQHPQVEMEIHHANIAGCDDPRKWCVLQDGKCIGRGYCDGLLVAVEHAEAICRVLHSTRRRRSLELEPIVLFCNCGECAFCKAAAQKGS